MRIQLRNKVINDDWFPFVTGSKLKLGIKLIKENQPITAPTSNWRFSG